MEALRRKAWEGTTRVQNAMSGVYGNDAMLRQVAESVKDQPSGERISHQHKEGMELCKTS